MSQLGLDGTRDLAGGGCFSAHPGTEAVSPVLVDKGLENWRRDSGF